MTNNSSTSREQYSLKLTALQRDDLLDSIPFDPEIEKIIKQVTPKSQVVEFDYRQLDVIENELLLVRNWVRHPKKQRIEAVLKKVTNLLRRVRQDQWGIQPSTSRLTQVPDLCFQFKIILADIRPAIWRRIQVRDCSLADFHQDLQTVMGWRDCHLHEFEIEGESYGTPMADFGFGPELHDESDVLLSELTFNSGGGDIVPWVYLYDYGDSWRHWIVFEGYPTGGDASPLCLDGERSCPPEDIGGVWGYLNYLEALADQDHDSHSEFMTWGGPFDPEKFDAEQATAAMKRA